MSDADSNRKDTETPLRSHGLISLWAVLFVVSVFLVPLIWRF
jgi:multicomponent Na+:H+ antiporter subunit E